MSVSQSQLFHCPRVDAALVPGAWRCGQAVARRGRPPPTSTVLNLRPGRALVQAGSGREASWFARQGPDVLRKTRMPTRATALLLDGKLDPKTKILELLSEHRVMSVATVRPDGWPQATL